MHDERANFVREVQAGSNRSPICAASTASAARPATSGWTRYDREGVAGLADRSRAPRHQPNAVGADEQAAILALRAQRPTWGERKLHAFLQRQQPEHAWPSPSTIGAILKRHGLTYQRRRRRYATPSSTLSDATAPNRVWAIDFKGHFRTGDGVRCDPLTINRIRPAAICCAAKPWNDPTTSTCGRCWSDLSQVRTAVGVALRQRAAVCVVAVGGLSRLSVWFLRLGVRPERIEPGHPEQNGRHERMASHVETRDGPAASDERGVTATGGFARFQCEYKRPHEALGMATPERGTSGDPARLPEMEYPDGYERRRVYEHGDIHWSNHAVRCSVGLEQDSRAGASGLVRCCWRVWPRALVVAAEPGAGAGRVFGARRRSPYGLAASRSKHGVGGGGRERALPWRNIEKCYPCAWVILLPMSQATYKAAKRSPAPVRAAKGRLRFWCFGQGSGVTYRTGRIDPSLAFRARLLGFARIRAENSCGGVKPDSDAGYRSAQ